MEETEKKKSCNNHNSCPRCKCRGDKKLNVYDWLDDIPESHNDTDFVEVQFKNTRKGYYKNSNKLDICKGDVVAVEATPGHDIGEITLTGRLVLLQMKKNNIRTDNVEIKRVYRKAKPADIEKYEEAKAREHDTMLRARKIAEDLKLNMKIGDVEYQGDCNKAIFYYIADERVDFRQLIKVLADAFKVRIEMKQIGARQEAGRIGGIGPCGRELCCSGWMTNFVSVATSAARFQEISLNPQKLAGQCAKLKCCMNYEVDGYVEAQKQLPSKEAVLYTKQGEYYHFKTDIYKFQLTYSTSKDFPANLVTISSSRVFEIIALNKRGIKVEALEVEVNKEEPKKDFSDVVGQDSLTRFDTSKKNKKIKNKRPQRDNNSSTSDQEKENRKPNQRRNEENKLGGNNNQNSQNRQNVGDNQNNNDNKNQKRHNQSKGNRLANESGNQNSSENRENKPNGNQERGNDLRKNNNQSNNQNQPKGQNEKSERNQNNPHNNNNKKNKGAKPNQNQKQNGNDFQPKQNVLNSKQNSENGGNTAVGGKEEGTNREFKKRNFRRVKRHENGREGQNNVKEKGSNESQA